METSVLITVFVTLFVVIDPIGLTPMFVTMTRGVAAARRRRIGIRACLVAFALLTMFGLFGEAVLAFVGISMAAFRIAGGILLFLTALDMLFERRSKRRQEKVDIEEESDSDDPSVFPLGMPLIAGPGSIATMILLTGQASGDWTAIFAYHLIMAAVLVLVLILFLAAGLIERVLGETGVNVVTRLLGMLLAALSVQFVLDGIREFLPLAG